MSLIRLAFGNSDVGMDMQGYAALSIKGCYTPIRITRLRRAAHGPARAEQIARAGVVFLQRAPHSIIAQH